jgi:UDP-N-acetylglucosamine acyltransferase
MMKIHPTAVVDRDAVIGEDVEIGPGAVVAAGVTIGAGCRIGPHAMLDTGTILEPNVRVFTGAVIGTEPQDIKYTGTPTGVHVGEGTIIREYVTINRATGENGMTRIGPGCMLMANVHIAHECKIGKKVVLANLATLGGHVEVEDNAVIGGMAALHQYVRVGSMAMVGGASGLMKDAPPYMITFGYPPARVYGVNKVGLKRHGLSEEVRDDIKRAFKFLFRSGLNYTQGLERIRSEINPSPEINHLVEFFDLTSRGISPSSRQNGLHHIAESGYADGALKSTVTMAKQVGAI